MGFKSFIKKAGKGISNAGKAAVNQAEKAAKGTVNNVVASGKQVGKGFDDLGHGKVDGLAEIAHGTIGLTPTSIMLAPAQIAAGAGAGALAGAVGARKYEDQIAGIVAAPSSVANVGHSAIEAVASAGHGNWGDALTNAGNVGMNATPQMMIMNTVGDKMGQVIGLGMQIKMDHEGKAANPESTLRSPEAADQPVNDAAGAPIVESLPVVSAGGASVTPQGSLHPIIGTDTVTASAKRSTGKHASRRSPSSSKSFKVRVQEYMPHVGGILGIGAVAYIGYLMFRSSSGARLPQRQQPQLTAQPQFEGSRVSAFPQSSSSLLASQLQ